MKYKLILLSSLFSFASYSQFTDTDIKKYDVNSVDGLSSKLNSLKQKNKKTMLIFGWKG